LICIPNGGLYFFSFFSYYIIISTLDYLLVHFALLAKMGNNLSVGQDAITKEKMEAAKEEIGKSGARLYVIHSVQNKVDVVSVIDTDTYQVITTIDVGDDANRLVLNAAGTRLYVTSRGKWYWQGDRLLRRQGQVFVIDTNTHKVIAQLDVDQNPVALLLNPAETRLYITNNMGNTVTVIHTDTFEKVTICVGKAPVASVLNSAGTRLYVVNRDSHNITVIDADTYREIATIRVDYHPSDLVLNAEENRLYVANELSGTVSVIDTVTQEITTIDVGRTPGALVLNSAEAQLYVANFENDTISVIDTNTHHQVTIIPTCRSPRHLVLNSAKNCLYVNSRDLYANRRGGDEVISIDTVTYQKIATIPVSVRPETRAYAAALVLNAAQTRLYVVNQMSHNIFVIDTATHQVIAVIDVEGKPEAIAIREGSVIGDEVRFRSLSCNTVV
jgi:YVTN family beta-propeller protein